MHKSFIYDGVNSADLNIWLTAATNLSEPVPNITTYKIPGRSGNLNEWDGSYNNRTLKMSCVVVAENAELALAAVNRAFFANSGYKKLFLPDDSCHYLMAELTKGARREPHWSNGFAEFDLEFSCQPQRYLTTGSIDASIDAQGLIYPSSYTYPASDLYPYATEATFVNPYFPSKPSITVYGDSSTDAEVVIGDCTITIEACAVGGVVIDCDIMDCYNASTKANWNSKVSFSTGDFPELPTGETLISWNSSGVKSIKIEPRWWDL